MSKKALVLAIASAFLCSTSRAQVLKNFKLDGQIDLQGTSANNVKDFTTDTYDHLSDVQARILLNAGWDFLDDVHSMLTVGANDLSWGAEGASEQQFVGPGSNGSSHANYAFISQGYLKIDKVMGAVDVTLGRQYYGDPGDIVAYFGPYQNLYGLSVSAIDAARLDLSNEFVGFTALGGKIKGSAPGISAGVANGATGGGDIDVEHVNFSIKGNDVWGASLYGWLQTTHDTPNEVPFGLGTPNAPVFANDQLWVLGLKNRLNLGPVSFKIEGAKDFGENRTLALDANSPANTIPGPAMNYDGWALKADLSVKVDLDVVTFEPWGEFDDASGGAHDNKNFNFVGINPDFRPGGIYGYFSSISAAPLGSGISSGLSSNTLSNRTIWGTGLKTSWAGRLHSWYYESAPSTGRLLTFGLSYWDYRLQNKSGTASDFASHNTHLGSEFDVNMTWKHSDNVTFTLGWGQYWVGGLVKNAINAENILNATPGQGTDPVMLAQFSTTVKF